MLFAGSVPLAVMMVQYYRSLKRMGANVNVVSNPNFQMAFAILLLGAILLGTLIARMVLQ